MADKHQAKDMSDDRNVNKRDAQRSSLRRSKSDPSGLSSLVPVIREWASEPSVEISQGDPVRTSATQSGGYFRLRSVWNMTSASAKRPAGVSEGSGSTAVPNWGGAWPNTTRRPIEPTRGREGMHESDRPLQADKGNVLPQAGVSSKLGSQSKRRQTPLEYEVWKDSRLKALDWDSISLTLSNISTESMKELENMYLLNRPQNLPGNEAGVILSADASSAMDWTSTLPAASLMPESAPGTSGQNRGQGTRSHALLSANYRRGASMHKRQRLDNDSSACSSASSSDPPSFLLVEFSGPRKSEMERYDALSHPPYDMRDRSGILVLLIFRIWIPREFINMADFIKPHCRRVNVNNVIDNFIYTCRVICEAASPGRMTFLVKVNDPEIKDFAIGCALYLKQQYDEFSSLFSLRIFYRSNGVNLIWDDTEIQTYPLEDASESIRTLHSFFSDICQYLEKIFYERDRGNVELLQQHMNEISGRALAAFKSLSNEMGQRNFASRGEWIINALWELLDCLKANPCPNVTMLYMLKDSVMRFIKDGCHQLSRSDEPEAMATARVGRARLHPVVLISQKMFQCAFLPSPPPSIYLVDKNDETIPFDEEDTS